jgi:hypothetical protein
MDRWLAELFRVRSSPSACLEIHFHGGDPEIVPGRIDDRDRLVSRNLQIFKRVQDFRFGIFVRDQADGIPRRIGVFKSQLVPHFDEVISGVKDQHAPFQPVFTDFEGKLVLPVHHDFSLSDGLCNLDLQIYQGPLQGLDGSAFSLLFRKAGVVRRDQGEHNLCHLGRIDHPHLVRRGCCPSVVDPVAEGILG